MEKTRETYKDGKLIKTEILIFPDLPYDEARKQAYPDMGDQLDAIWEELSSKTIITSEAAAMLDAILAVKAKYPKPEE